MIEAVKFIPWLPALAAVLCGLCCVRKSLRGLAAVFCIAGIAGAFVLSVIAAGGVTPNEGGVPDPVVGFEWINIGDFSANFNFLIDPLTVIMLFVVTGIGTLVAVYASGYMKGDPGYARFFAFVSLFIFAMTCLVLADNLVLMYLGWEGVGLCSYLLIGFYYKKPSAVAAAKKAFIVNRIGDLGFALGIFLTWTTFDTVILSGSDGVIAKAMAMGNGEAVPQSAEWIPFLLMLGAFGKSAQIPLYVWLPDAMEGPTPVSALIHAATMVTAGVYMIARLLPVFQLSSTALMVVATVGALTAFMAASIALCQYDLKKVFAYSTISQLGYMFLGVGVTASVGGVFHLFTHAFFKALLFLTAGSVMHAAAGQLDLRKLSGLRHRMPVTCWLMFAGCLALAGVPYIAAGFYSKDMIIAATLEQGMDLHNAWLIILAIIAIVTAFMTAYYTFRLWFRVFMGPEFFEMGDEHHHDEDAHGHEDHAHAAGSGGGHHDGPHEMPWLMNGPLVILAVGSIIAGFAFEGWITHNVLDSTAQSPVGVHHGEAHHHILGLSVHWFMVIVSFIVSLGGIAVAGHFHWGHREQADEFAARLPGLVKVLQNKWYVDELYDAVIVKPLKFVGNIFFVIDRMLIEGLVNLIGLLPGIGGRIVQPTQQGALQGYGLGMALTAAAVVIIVALIGVL